MENLETGLLLMVVGMITVFIILLIVINLGKLLIALVNRFAPEEVVPVKKAAGVSTSIPPHVLAAITAAVNVVTDNKGKIVKVERKK